MSKILSTAVVAGLLFALTAPAIAADAPKTKTECDKLTDMKWDSKTKTLREEMKLFGPRRQPCIVAIVGFITRSFFTCANPLPRFM